MFGLWLPLRSGVVPASRYLSNCLPVTGRLGNCGTTIKRLYLVHISPEEPL